MKRAFDIFGALSGLVVLAPLFLVIAAFVKFSDLGPVLYRQERVGRYGKRFKILKFRSMAANAQKMGKCVAKDRVPRITPIGRILRKTKLDGLPQLWNVLMGEMSFVGPRPELPRYVAQYTNGQHRILDFTPGITDVAALLFRTEEQLFTNVGDAEEFYIEHCIPKRLDLSLEYAERATFLTDLAVMAQTLLPHWLTVFCLYSVILLLSGFIALFVWFGAFSGH